VSLAPRLVCLSLIEIAGALGFSTTPASKFRRGLRLPALRPWQVLAELIGSAQYPTDADEALSWQARAWCHVSHGRLNSSRTRCAPRSASGSVSVPPEVGTMSGVFASSR